MSDKLVRSAFRENVLNSADHMSETYIVNELGLKNGQARADIAVLNGKLIGYEIKTERDNLVRLPSQVLAYNEVFDNIYVIIAQKHLQGVLTTIPVWWGIFIINENPDGYYFKCIRKAKKNRWKERMGIAQLLWKDEVIEILATRFKFQPKAKADKHHLYSILIEKCSASQLTKFALDFLKRRSDWRADLQPLS